MSGLSDRIDQLKTVVQQAKDQKQRLKTQVDVYDAQITAAQQEIADIQAFLAWKAAK